MQGSSSYQKSSLKYHNLLAPHDLARNSKENFNVQKAGLSIPPRKVVQQIPAASAKAKSLQEMNEKDQVTVIKLNEIAYYIVLHRLPFKQFKHLVKL